MEGAGDKMDWHGVPAFLLENGAGSRTRTGHHQLGRLRPYPLDDTRKHGVPDRTQPGDPRLERALSWTARRREHTFGGDAQPVTLRPSGESRRTCTLQHSPKNYWWAITVSNRVPPGYEPGALAC